MASFAYKVTFVNGTTHQEIKTKLVAPAATEAPAYWSSGSADGSTLPLLNQSIASKSSGKIGGLDIGITTVTSETFETKTAVRNYFLGFGFDNRIYLDRLGVGDKWVFGNGSYIIVSAITQGSSNLTISLEYRNSGGTVCYNTSVQVNYNNDQNCDFYTFPLLQNPFNVTNYKLVRWNYQCYGYGNRASIAFGNPFNPVSDALAESFWRGVKPADEENPYEDAGTSTEGGGDPANQNFDDTSDSVEEDPMPTLSAIGTGMATLFNPSQSQLQALASVFWGSQWWNVLQNTVEGIDKMFVSLGVLPFTATTGATVEVEWLGLAITEVFLTLAGQQYYEFDMGTIDLSSDNRIFRSDTALDYSPFSKLGIFLPFIGYQELDIDECRGNTIQLKYRIDILSGACVALVKIAGNTIYQFAGNCITQIPITSQSFENLMTNVVNVGIAAAKMKTVGAVAGGGDTVTDEALNRKDKPITKAMADYQHSVHSAQVSNARYGLENATANAMMGLKPTYDKTGAISSSASLMCVKQPFLFLTTPRMCVPEHLQRYAGFPANITDTLGNFEGYTVVNSIRLNNLVATSPEIEEIYELLHDGVII